MKGSHLILLVVVALGVTFSAILRYQFRILDSTLASSFGPSSFSVRQVWSIQPENVTKRSNVGKLDEEEAPSSTKRTLPGNGKELKPASALKESASFGNLEEVKGMSSCLFIMDDTIRLIEWLAYHYTVLPLQYLIVGIDPHSTNPHRIVQVLDRWKSYINITVWDDPQTYLAHVPWDKGWKRKYWLAPGVMNPLYNNKTSHGYKSQEHKRRQNIFTTYCYREHFAAKRNWVINLDTDEFLIPNYISTNEDTNSSSFVIHYIGTDEKLERDRTTSMTIRRRLPSLAKRVTVSEILDQTNLDRCLKIPSLNFTSQRGQYAYHGAEDTTGKLITLLQSQTGPREGRTTKAILDLSRARLEYLVWQKFVNVHNPNKRMCGWNGVIGSGTDFISSAFRYHHYVAGSLETSFERAQDYRLRESGIKLKAHFESRNFEPIQEENTDIFPWLPWFLNRVGQDAAHELLFAPLEEAYTTMRIMMQSQKG